jgi:chemotaxis protein MotB
VSAHAAAGRRRRGGGHGGGHEGGDERWLLTYADMITLLMALFMVLFSISSVNISKYRVLQHALQKAFRGGVLEGGKGVTPGDPSSIDGVHTATPSQQVDAKFTILAPNLIGRTAPNQARAERSEENDLARMQRQTEEYARAHGFAGRIRTSIDQRGLVIRLLTDGVLFASGEATLKPTAAPLLARVSGLLVHARFDNPIRVEGNTDDVPISGGAYRSNWELSTARATAVLQSMLAHGVPPARLSVAGYADQHPIAPNATADGRAANRRVDIVVVRTASTPQGDTLP